MNILCMTYVLALAVTAFLKTLELKAANDDTNIWNDELLNDVESGVELPNTIQKVSWYHWMVLLMAHYITRFNYWQSQSTALLNDGNVWH